MLNRENLRGIWAGLPTAWKKDGSLDENVFREDIKRCCQYGVHGVYSGGTTGEFYAQDLELFKEINTILRDETKKYNIPIQIGCTATSTKEVIKRVNFAAKIGADGVQVALPFWMSLTNQEVIKFFNDISGISSLPIISYNTERTKKLLKLEDYRRILDEGIKLIGVKQTGNDFELISKLTQLPLNVFVSEHILADAMKLGAKGSYSSFVYLNPYIILSYYQFCFEGRWKEAYAIQEKINLIMKKGIGPLLNKGYKDSALDRVLGRAVGFLKCSLQTQPPYKSVTEEEFLSFKKWLKNNLPEFLVL